MLQNTQASHSFYQFQLFPFPSLEWPEKIFTCGPETPYLGFVVENKPLSFWKHMQPSATKLRFVHVWVLIVIGSSFWCYFGSLQSICTTIELQSSILFSTSLRTTGVYEGIALSMKLSIWKQHNVPMTIFAVQAWKVCPFGRHALWTNGNLLDRRPSLCLASEVVDKASFDLKKHSRFQIHRLTQKWALLVGWNQM